VADAVSYPGKSFDLIAFFDCLHDMGDPVGVTRHARQALNPVLANVYQPASCKLEINLAGIGRRWLELERAMGIEYIAGFRLQQANQIVATGAEHCV
jgi:hypothetical protein